MTEYLDTPLLLIPSTTVPIGHLYPHPYYILPIRIHDCLSVFCYFLSSSLSSFTIGFALFSAFSILVCCLCSVTTLYCSPYTHLFNSDYIVLRLHRSMFAVHRLQLKNNWHPFIFPYSASLEWSSITHFWRYRKTWIPLLGYGYYRIIFTAPTLLQWNFPHPRGNYRGDGKMCYYYRVLVWHLKLTKKSNLIGKLWYELIWFLDNSAVATIYFWATL